jgi:hypothetical protein
MKKHTNSTMPAPIPPAPRLLLPSIADADAVQAKLASYDDRTTWDSSAKRKSPG